MKRNFVLALALFVSVVYAQAPWPMERQDRWGSGRAIVGPPASDLTTPWISNKLAHNLGPVSHGAALGENGIGYFGNWVNGRLYKFNYNTGAIHNSFLTIDWVSSIPALGANNQVFVGTEGKFFAVNSSNMEFDWFRSTGYIGGSPVLGPEGHVIYVTASGIANRINPITGMDVWTRTGFGVPRGAVCFSRDDSKVVFSHGNSVTALNYSDGSTAWSITIGSGTSQPSAAPSGEIILGTLSGLVYALDPDDGSVLWTKQTLDKITGGVAFSPDGTVAYVPSFDWRVYAFKVSDGTKLWSFATTHWCEYAPTVGFDGSIYVHNKFGDLYRISPSGSQIWHARLNGEARGTFSIGPDGSLFVGYTGDNDRGLAIIRQRPWETDNQSISVERGKLLVGSLAHVHESDNSYYQVQQAYDTTRTERPLRLVLTANSVYRPISEIRLKLETSVSADNVQQFVELYSFTTGSWVQVDSRTATQSDTSFELGVQNAEAYCSANGEMRVKVSYMPSSSAPSSRLVVNVDQVKLSVVPQFRP